QLLSGYIIPVNPPIHDNQNCALTPTEVLSLKHYLRWMQSHGTVKAYRLHAQLLYEATGIEILSLYLVRKLATELTGISTERVDMCPKSCMAYTGEFKDLTACIYIRDKHPGPCGEPRFNAKGQPRAQMVYIPFTPVIQSYYANQETAHAMRYRHECLEDTLRNQALGDNAKPQSFSDFPNSSNHVFHRQGLDLFTLPTDTAITISSDGAQLTTKKQSDVYIFTITILNLPPDKRYRASNIIIPLIIPGPSAPGNVESF
ncbi:hypothetical protein BC834DRAFT_800359, partial [Gloeopeniophorella convolvens]